MRSHLSAFFFWISHLLPPRTSGEDSRERFGPATHLSFREVFRTSRENLRIGVLAFAMEGASPPAAGYGCTTSEAPDNVKIEDDQRNPPAPGQGPPPTQNTDSVGGKDQSTQENVLIG